MATATAARKQDYSPPPVNGDFYQIENILILGRVTSGAGGGIIVHGAEEVLRQEFPDLASQITFHMPDEKEKRHGQAMAAASLPVIGV